MQLNLHGLWETSEKCQPPRQSGARLARTRQPAAPLADAMSLIKGQRYTWSEIVDKTEADGTPPYYLLHRDGAVVAGCFTLELNP